MNIMKKSSTRTIHCGGFFFLTKMKEGWDESDSGEYELVVRCDTPLPFTFTALRMLDVSGSGFLITDGFIGCLPKTSLQTFTAKGCRVDPAGVDFSTLHLLHRIDLSGSRGIGEGEGTYSFPPTASINLADNGITDLSKLNFGKKFQQELDLSHNPIADFSISRVASIIGALKLNHTGITDIAVLNHIGCAHVHQLELTHNGIGDARPLRFSTNTINLSHNEITTAEFPWGNGWMNLSCNPITDISAIYSGWNNYWLFDRLSNKLFEGCPLDEHSRKVLSLVPRGSITVSQVAKFRAFIWTIPAMVMLRQDKRLPEELCRSLRGYLF